MKIGQKIQAFRESQGMTKDEFARKIGCSKNYITEIENNTFDTSVKFMKKLTSKFSAIRFTFKYSESGDDFIVTRIKKKQPVPTLIGTEKISEAMRDFRLEKCMKQFEFGNALGYTRTYINEIENGKYNASQEFFKKMSEAFNCEVSVTIADGKELLEIA
jgi:transcriptional regulator with XRE-family HTH domain